MASAANAIAPFRDPSRPPTPPKEKGSRLNGAPAAQPVMSSRPRFPDTPEESPSSSAEDFKIGSHRSKKKVAWNQVIDKNYGNMGTLSKEFRQLPPSRECKSTKSILKVVHDKEDNQFQGHLSGMNLHAMLRSANDHLAGTSRSSYLDAYNTLLACVSTYEEEPKIDDLLGPIAELTRHIKRDILFKPTGDVPSDMHLVPTALKITTAFLGSRTFASAVPEEFKFFIAEQSIAKLEDEKTSQVLLAHYMCVLEKSKLGPKIMTADRTQRLLAGLDRLGPRAKNIRIVCHRLMIYKQLLSQAKSVMSSRIETWLHHLFSGLLSSVRDVRSRAIVCGIEAGLQIGATSNVSRSCSDIMNQRIPSDKKIIEILHTRALSTLESKEDATQIPQIWSVLILLQRSRRSRIESWEHFGRWKEVIQLCLESADLQTTHQTHLALNRLMFTINVDVISTSMAITLQRLLEPQLKPQCLQLANEKKAVISKQSARSTYCIALYYAFHPAASYPQMDLCWDRLVADILFKSLVQTTADTRFACEVIASLLFNDGPPRIWDERKANSQGPVHAAELPTLDSKWVRSRAGKVLDTLDALSNKVEQGCQDAMEPIWKHLVAAVGNACSKDVRVSNDTLGFLAHLLSLLKRRFERISTVNMVEAEVKWMSLLLDQSVVRIGNLPLNEKRIILNDQKRFELASETPSHRLKSNATHNNSAAELLLKILIEIQPSGCGKTLSEPLRKIINIVAPASNPWANRIKALRNLSRLCDSEGRDESSQSRYLLWQAIAKDTIGILEEQQNPQSKGASPQISAQDYRDITKNLEVGMHLSTFGYYPFWEKMYEKAVQFVSRQNGTLAVTIQLVEPLASALRRRSESLDDEFTEYARKLLDNAYWAPSRQVYERNLAQQWELGRVPRTMPDAGFGEDVYWMVEAILQHNYSGLSSLTIDCVQVSTTAIVSFVQTCPPYLARKVFHRLQHSLSVWIEDAGGVLQPPNDSILPKIQQIWSLFATFTREARDSGNELLATVSVLMTAGLQSRHRSIVNDAILLWNQKFGSLDTLDYTDDLQAALIRLKSVVDIDTPGLNNTLSSPCDLSPIHLIDSQESVNHAGRQQISGTLPSQRSQRERISTTPKSAVIDSQNPGKASESHQLKNSRNGKVTPKAVRRHDDSQMHFAAIGSSPLESDVHDSIAMTDHQQEVLDRQKQDAALFPDINPTAEVTYRTSTSKLPKFALRARETSKADPAFECETSPTLPSEDLIAGLLGSSPTPSSSRHRSEERKLDEEMPSSPPLILSRPSHQQLPDSQPAEQAEEGASNIKHKHDQDSSEMPKQQLTHASSSVGSIAQPSMHDTPLEDSNRIYDAECDALLAALREEHPAVLSLDGPGAQSQARPDEEDQGTDLSCDAQTSDDRQIEAQILSEMQGAIVPHADQSQHLPAKRKRAGLEDAPLRERKRRAVVGQEIPTADGGRSHEVAADCVLIDARPVSKGIYQSVSPEKAPEVKLERSESPVGIPAAMESAAPSKAQRIGLRAMPISPQNGQRRTSRRRVEVKQEHMEDATSITEQCHGGATTDTVATRSSGSSAATPQVRDGRVNDSRRSSGVETRGRRPGLPRGGQLTKERRYLDDVRRILGSRKQMKLSSKMEGELREILLQTSLESQLAENESKRKAVAV